MSTATTASTTTAPGTLSKKQRKQLRKQMMQRKEQLLAKHGRSENSQQGGPAAGTSTSDSRLSSTRMFSDIKPKLPADPPKPARNSETKPPTWTPPNQPEPHRSLTAITPKPEPRHGNLNGRRSLRPRVRDTVHAVTPSPAIVRDLDDIGPGPLTRAAAALENTGRHAVRLWKQRPWQNNGHPANATRGDTHRGLSLMIKPLRTLGLVAVVGAVVLGRESRSMGASDTGSFVVLGMGLGLAVGLLALAEIAGALRTIVRRL